MIPWLMHNSVLAAMLALGVAAFCRLARPNPAVRHALWLVVLVRLLLPPGLDWPWAVPLPAKADPAKAAALTTSEFAGERSPDVEILAFDLVDMAHPNPPAVADDMPASDVTATAAPVNWLATLASAASITWFLGVGVLSLRHLLRFVRLHRAMARGLPAPAALVQRVCDLAGKLAIRPPRVLVVPGLTSPLVGCLPRPVLLWPAGLEGRLASDGLRAVLAHELAHLRRRDHWVRWLELAAECLWWWNPVFLFVRRRIRHNAELACDAWVLTILPKARRAYAEALLTVCETAARGAEPAPALGIGGDDRRDFQKRLTMIMREPVACRLPRRALVAIALLAALAIPGWTLGRATDKPAGAADSEQARGEPLPVFPGDILIELVEEAEQAKAQPASSERDQKLKEIEEKIQALLKEIQALRKLQEQEKAGARSAEAQRTADHAIRARAYQEATAHQTPRSGIRSTGATSPARATYTLAPEKAKALEAFFKTYLKASVLEAKVDGDTLSVTTTPEAHQAIHELIGLIQSSAAPDRRRYRLAVPAKPELKQQVSERLDLQADLLDRGEPQPAAAVRASLAYVKRLLGQESPPPTTKPANNAAKSNEPK